MRIVLLIALLFQAPRFPTGMDNFKYATAKYGCQLGDDPATCAQGIVTFPKRGGITIKYDDLYPGERFYGGCDSDDITQPGAKMKYIETRDYYQITWAVPGHKIRWGCHWSVRNLKYKEPNANSSSPRPIAH
jgi:hypothetical protein